MAAALHLLVRIVHVLGMAVLFGGAAVVWIALRAAPRDRDPSSLVVRYEWVFWGTMGVMVVTGVGNLGALGAPGPGTRWGTLLSAKLLIVLAFVLGSFLRAFVVLALRDRDAGGHAVLRPAYGATAVALLVIVALAEVLAHG